MPPFLFSYQISMFYFYGYYITRDLMCQHLFAKFVGAAVVKLNLVFNLSDMYNYF